MVIGWITRGGICCATCGCCASAPAVGVAWTRIGNDSVEPLAATVIAPSPLAVGAAVRVTSRLPVPPCLRSTPGTAWAHDDGVLDGRRVEPGRQPGVAQPRDVDGARLAAADEVHEVVRAAQDRQLRTDLHEDRDVCGEGRRVVRSGRVGDLEHQRGRPVVVAARGELDRRVAQRLRGQDVLGRRAHGVGRGDLDGAPARVGDVLGEVDRRRAVGVHLDDLARRDVGRPVVARSGRRPGPSPWRRRRRR